MDERGGLVVYVTSHGFGHLNRAVAVINRMPAGVPVTVRCHPNLFDHWRERLRRPAALEAHVSDAGAVNPPGDSAATDGAATLELAIRVHAEAMARVDEEAQRLRDGGAGAVLCDAPPVPLIAARRAGVPGFVLANFTWADIYAPHARRLGADAVAFVAEVRRAYRQAVALFRAEPAMRMADFDRDKVIEVGMVVTPGRDRGDELRRLIGLDPKAKLVYWYVGPLRAGRHRLGPGRGDGVEGGPLRRLPPGDGRARCRTFTSSRPTSGPGPTSPRRPTRSSPRPVTARPARRWSRAPR